MQRVGLPGFDYSRAHQLTTTTTVWATMLGRCLETQPSCVRHRCLSGPLRCNCATCSWPKPCAARSKARGKFERQVVWGPPAKVTLELTTSTTRSTSLSYSVPLVVHCPCPHNMMFYIGVTICFLAYFFARRSRTEVQTNTSCFDTSDVRLTSHKAVHRSIVQREGCQPLRCLPNRWFPPFGLDKLGKVLEAEKTKAYPLLTLGDHEKYGGYLCSMGWTYVYCHHSRHCQPPRDALGAIQM